MRILGAMHNIECRSDVPLFLKENALNRNICEVGVRFAYNFEQLLAAQPLLAVAIDHYMDTGIASEQDTGMDQKRLEGIHGEVFKRFLYAPNVRIFRGRSEVAARLFPLRFFDYVYIDADHSFKGTLEDVCLWWEYVRQGGILAGHDYINTDSRNGVEFGVIKAIQKFMKDRKMDSSYLHNTEHGYRSWFLYKEEGE
jgi:hypothetical protein